MTSEQLDLSKLRELLTKRFDVEELRSLVFDLGVDYDSLRGEGQAAKARELVAYLERRDRVLDLVELGQKLRPDVPWQGVVQARKGDFHKGLASSDDCAAWRRQLAELKSNLLLIEERLSQFVMDTDLANLQLVKRKRYLEKQIAELQDCLATHCEGNNDIDSVNFRSADGHPKQDRDSKSSVDIEAQKIRVSGNNVLFGHGDITNINVESDIAFASAQQSARDREASLRRQLVIHRKNLSHLEEQLSKYGKMDAPLHLLNQIEDEEEEIRRKEKLLDEIGGQDA